MKHYLHLQLGLICGRLGLGERAHAYFDGVRRRWAFAGKAITEMVEHAEAAAQPPQYPPEPVNQVRFEQEVDNALQRYDGRLVDHPTDDLVEEIASALANEQTVALVRPVDRAGPCPPVDSLVLCHPSSVTGAKKLSQEFGIYTAPCLRSFLALSEASTVFTQLDGKLPLVLQDTAIKRQHQERLVALAPQNLRGKVVHPTLEPLLDAVLRAHYRKTGFELVATLAFRVFGHDLATDARSAIESFLISSVDRLVLGEQLLSKRVGAEAPNNLLPFKPRLSVRASLTAKHQGSNADDAHFLAVHTGSARKLYRLSPMSQSLLSLCDGERTAGEIANQLSAELAQEPAQTSQAVGETLRNLYHQRAICFSAE